MEIEIEITRGQYRIKNGKARQYAADYGYITETHGADNEPIDVYRGLFPNSKMAYIINQYHGGIFDEHKVMLDFYDKEQAINAYRLTTGNTPEIFSCTMQQLKWWLQFGNHAAPVTTQSFPFDNENEDMMTQGLNTNWTDKTAAQFIYEMRKTDEYGELTEAATLDAICFDEEQDGAQIEFHAAFDALAVENKRLEKTAQLLGLALNRTSGSLKVVENGIQISAPMKKNGTTNIAVMYEMTDGQTVSVLFHNPDTTPAKIAPDDVLISWKWLLNRKDITIVVAKENGKDLPLPTVARRVMALVEKNTARFAKANANKAAETEELARLESEKAQKLARLEELNAQIEARNNSGSLKTEPLDESALEPLNVPENATAKEVRKALETYLKQLQGKTITTSDGKTVRFSGKSTGHITNDIMQRENGLALQAAEFAVEVLKTGQFIERQELYKAREKDGFVAFHTYRKWVELKDGTKMNLQVKAGELQNGLLVAGDGLIAYAMKNAEKIKEAENNPTSFTGDSANDVSGISQLPHRPTVQVEPTSTSQCNNHTAIYDAAQDNEPYIFIEILEVREKNSGSLKTKPFEFEIGQTVINDGKNGIVFARYRTYENEPYNKNRVGYFNRYLVLPENDLNPSVIAGVSFDESDLVKATLDNFSFTLKVLKQFKKLGFKYQDYYSHFDYFRNHAINHGKANVDDSDVMSKADFNALIEEELDNFVFSGLTGREYFDAVSKQLGKLGWEESISTNIRTGKRKRSGSNFHFYDENSKLLFNVRTYESLSDVTETAFQLFQGGSATDPVLTVEIAGKAPQMVAEELNHYVLSQNNTLPENEAFKSNIPLTADKATFDEAENFVQTYFDDLNSEQAEILKNWLAENRLPDFLNEGKTSHYQALADYLGQEIINGIRNPKRFHVDILPLLKQGDSYCG